MDDIRLILYAILFGVFFIAGTLFATLFARAEAIELKTFWCVNLEEKKAIDLTCRVFRPNPLGPWIPYPVGSESCDCPAGYSEYKPFPELLLPKPSNASPG